MRKGKIAALIGIMAFAYCTVGTVTHYSKLWAATHEAMPDQGQFSAREEADRLTQNYFHYFDASCASSQAPVANADWLSNARLKLLKEFVSLGKDPARLKMVAGALEGRVIYENFGWRIQNSSVSASITLDEHEHVKDFQLWYSKSDCAADIDVDVQFSGSQPRFRFGYNDYGDRDREFTTWHDWAFDGTGARQLN